MDLSYSSRVMSVFHMSREQAKARIHRVGQKNVCHYIYLIAEQTVDSKVLQSLRDKTDLAHLLIDEWRSGKNPYEP